MRRLIPTILILTIFFSTSYGNVKTKEENDKEYIEIKKETDNTEQDRSLVMIECYLDRDSNTLELEYAGIGIPVVYICDFYGNIQSSQCATAGFGKVVLDLPSGEGMYQVVVQSNTYRGAGVFQIY